MGVGIYSAIQERHLVDGQGNPDTEERMGFTRQRETQRQTTAATVYVVDGDAGVRQGVRSLLGTLGISVMCCSSAEEFLECADFATPGCAIIEVHLPGISGLDLQERLCRKGIDFPVIVMTSEADVPMAVRAMALGALDFIEKPFIDRVLVSRVKQALLSVR